LTLQSELEQSLHLFKREHSKAVKVLYRSLPEKTLFGNEGLPIDPFADSPSSSPSSAQAPNDNLFRIYHLCVLLSLSLSFSSSRTCTADERPRSCFNYEEWSAELLHLLAVFIQIRATEEIVERELVERRRRWGPVAGLARFAGLLVGSSSARAAETSLNQKAALLRKQFCASISPPTFTPAPA